MKSVRFILFIMFVVSAISVSVFLSCGTKEEGVRVTSIKPVEIPETDAGVVSFVSGDVTLVKNGESNPAESGDIVTSNSTIRTGAGAECEITLGETAVVSIEEDTVCEINTLLLGMKSEVGLEVAIGSVLCKVKKLTENDTFNVKTGATVCGVRGTEFLVRTSETGATTVAVKTGRVVLLPPEVDTDNLENYAKLSYTEIVAVLERLETLAPSVSANEEIVVVKDTFKSTEEVYATLETVVAKAINKETVTKADLANLTKISDNASGRAKNPEAIPVSLSDTNKKKLAEIETFASFKGAGASMAGEAVAEVPKEKTKLVKLNIRTTPPEAEILVDGISAGFGKLSLLVAEGTDTGILARLPGYEDMSLHIIAKQGGDAEYRIELERIAGQPVNIVKQDNTEKQGSPVTDITQTNETAEQKDASVAKIPETEKDTAVKTDSTTEAGTKDKTDATVAVKEKTVKPEKVAIKGAYQVAHSAIKGGITWFDSTLILADEYGIVTCADAKGNRNWTLSTDNSPNENSYPVVIGNYVFFSGAQELVIADVKSGKLIAKKKLDSGSSHIFGRRVVGFESNALFPKDNGIEIINLADAGTIREIKIQKKSSMTPTVYKSKILIVDQEGNFLIINGASAAIEAEIQTKAIQPIGLAITLVKDKAFAAGRNGTVICVDLESQKLVWEKALAAGRKVSVTNDLLTGNAELYAYSNGTLYALSQSSGDPVFPPVSGLSGPPLYAAGKLYYGTLDKRFVIANAKTGKVEKSVTLDQKISSKPLLTATGSIFAGGESGAVFELDPGAF